MKYVKNIENIPVSVPPKVVRVEGVQTNKNFASQNRRRRERGWE